MKKLLLLVASASALFTTSVMAAPLEVPAATITDLQTTASNIGGSALTVFGAVALAAIGLAIFKKIFK